MGSLRNNKKRDEEFEQNLAARRKAIQEGTYESGAGVSTEDLQSAYKNQLKDDVKRVSGLQTSSDYQSAMGMTTESYANGVMNAWPSKTQEEETQEVEDDENLSLWQKLKNKYSQYIDSVQGAAADAKANQKSWYDALDEKLTSKKTTSSSNKTQAENMSSEQLKSKIEELESQVDDAKTTIDTWNGSKYDGTYAEAVKNYKSLKSELSDYESVNHLSDLEEQYNNLSDDEKDLLSEYTEKFNTASNTNQDTYSNLDEYDYASVAKQFKDKTGLDNVAELAQYNDRVTDQAEYEEESKEAAEYAKEHPVLATAKSVGGNLAGGYASILNRADYVLNGDKDQPYNIYDETSRMSALASDTREAVAQNISDYWSARNNAALGNALSFGYNTATSMLDSATAIAAGGGSEAVTLATMGLAAEAQQEREATENGASGTQAILSGLASGIAEGAFEKIPLDNLYSIVKSVKNGTKSGIKSAVFEVLKQANIEGLEEVGTDLTNFVTDELINGDNSSFQKAIEEYINAGYDEKTATSMAQRDQIVQVVQDYLAGAVSGGVFGAAAYGVGKAQSVYSGSKAQKNNETDTIVGKAVNIDHPEVEKAVNKYESNPSKSNLGELKAIVEGYENAYGEVEALSKDATQAYLDDKAKYAQNANAKESAETKESEDEEAIQSTSNTIQKSLVEATPETAARAVSDIRRAQTAQELESAYRYSQSLDNEDVRADAQTAYEIQSGKLQAESKATAEELNTWSESMTKEEAYEKGYNNEAADESTMLPEVVTAYKKGAAAGEIARIKEQKTQYESIDNKNIEVTNDGNTVTIDSFVKDGENIGIQVKDAGELKTVSADEVTTDNTQLQTLIQDATNLNTAYEANVYIANYSNNMSPSMYNTAAKRLINAGEVGQSFGKALETVSAFKGWMSTESMKELYEVGQKRAAEEKQESNQTTTADKKGEGKVTDNRSTTAEDNIYKAAVNIARLTGVDIVLEETGSQNQERGSFTFNDSTIHINTERDNAIKTLVHEAFGEFTEAYAPEEMETFYKDFIDLMMETSPDYFAGLAERYQNVYKEYEGEKSKYEAYKEMCNDFIIDLFDSDMDINAFVQAVADTKNQSFIDKIMKFFKAILDALEEMTGVKFKNEARVDEVRQKLLEATSAAIENYQKGKGNGSVGHAYDVKMIDYIDEALKDEGYQKPYVIESKINERLAEKIKELLGIDVSNYKNVITADDIRHINSRHGLNGKADKSMADMHELAYVKDIISDKNIKVRVINKISRSKRNSDGTYAKTIEIQLKTTEGFYYVVEAVPETSTKKMFILSMYKNKNDTFNQVLDENNPEQNVRNDADNNVSFVKDKVSQSEENVKNSHSLEVEYNEALKKNDTAMLDRLVRQAATEAGFDSPKLFHGTQAFRFTVLDTSMSDDGLTFFATNNLSIASSYSGATGQRGITENRTITDDNIAEMAKETGLFKNVEDFPSGDKQSRYEYLQRKYARMSDFAHKHEKEMRERGLYEDYLNFSNALFEGVTFQNINEGEVGKNLRKLLRPLKEAHYVISDYAHEIENVLLLTNNNGLNLHALILDNMLKTAEQVKNDYLPGETWGNYGLYANTDNMLEVDGKGANWNTISGENGEKLATREIAQRAKDQGYDGVIIRNITDDGGKNRNKYHYNELGDIYIFFNPQSQCKSADPVTYDDNGEVIPLSERFNREDKDIRYSLEVDTEGRTLSEGQQSFFKDSKVRDSEGRLIQVYHGTTADFTVFDLEMARGTADIEAFFFSNDYEESNGYGDNVGTYYLNITNPADYDTAYDIFHSFKGQEGAGVKTREKLQSMGYDGVIAEDDGYTEYLAFSPEQIKRTDNLNPTADPDVRYSLEVLDDGTKYVKLDGNLYDDGKGGTLTDRQAYDKIVNEIGFIELDGEDVYFVKRLPGNKNVVDELLRRRPYFEKSITDRKELTEKINHNIVELLSASEMIPFGENTPDINGKHQKYNIKSFDNRTVKFADDVGAYRLDLTVANLYDGRKVAYAKKYVEPDVNLLKKIEDKNVGKIPTVLTSKDKVTPTETDVNTKSHSLEVSRSFDIDDVFNKMFMEDYTGNMISILEEGAKALKNKEVNTSAIRQIAQKITKEYSSTYGVKNLTDDLEKLFAYMQSEGTTSYEDLMSIAAEIAMPVIENSETIDPEEKRRYDKFIKELKGYRIKLSESQKAEVKYAYGSLKEYRNQTFGKVAIANDGTYLVSVWNEICDMAPDFLNREVSDADQPIELLDAINAMKPQAHTVAMESYRGDNVAASYDLAMEIVTEYFKAMEQDNIKKALNAERGAYQQKIREQYAERYKDAKASNQEVNEAKIRSLQNRLSGLQKTERSKYTNAIKKDALRLIKWLDEPSKTNHVPENLREISLEFLAGIDFVSHRAKEESKTTKRWQERMQTVINLLNAAQSEEEYTINLDPDFVSELTAFTKRNDSTVKISQLDNVQLRELSQLMSRLKKMITSSNEVLANEQYKHVSDIGNGVIAHLKDRIKEKGEKGHHKTKLTEVADHFLNWDMLDAFNYFDTWGEAGKSLMNELSEGFNTRAKHLKAAGEYVEGVRKQMGLKSSQIAKWTGKNAAKHTFNVRGKEIEMTTGQLMNLYVLAKREQARAHIRTGGIKIEWTGFGKRATGTREAVHITPEIWGEMTDVLTKEQKDFADKLQAYLASDVAEWGNHTSMKQYGYKKFKEKDYWPIRVDSNTTDSRDSSESKDTSLYAVNNYGFTKNVTPKASNPVVMQDIFDVFTNHVTQMATYDGYAIPLSDLMRVYNYKYANETYEGDEYIKDNVSVKGTLDAAYGNPAKEYFIQLMKDINGQSEADPGATMSEYLVSAYKGAAIGGNLRVAVQQPTAIARAANLLGPQDMAHAVPTAKAIKEAEEYSMRAWWKTQGYYETSMGHSMKQVVTGVSTKLETVKDTTSVLAEKGDEITWGAIWNACRAKVDRTTDYKKNSQLYYMEVAKVFDEVIDRTQVMDSVLHRSQIMRSKNGLVKMATAFMSEPTKSYNMLRTAWLSGDNKKRGRALATYVVNVVLTAAAAALVDALRDDEKEDYMKSWLENFKENTAENINPITQIPYINAVMNYITQGYGSQRMDMEALENTIDGTKEVYEYVYNYVTDKPLDQSDTLYGLVKNIAKGLSQLSGVPMYNVMRDLEAIYETVSGQKLEEDFNKYKKFEDAVESGADLKDIISYYADYGVEADTLANHLKSMYSEEYVELVKSDPTEAEKLKEKLLDAAEQLGKDPDQYENTIDNWVRSANGEETVSYSVYNGIYTAIEDGEGLSDAIEAVIEKKKEEDSDKTTSEIKSTIASAITSKYKEEYLSLLKSDKTSAASLKSKLITAYQKLGYSSSDAKDKIESWSSTTSSSGNVSEYQGVYDAIDSGKNIDTAVKEMQKSGKEDSTIKTSVSRKYHSTYVELLKTNKTKAAALKSKLTAVYEYLGDDSDTIADRFEEWESE